MGSAALQSVGFDVQLLTGSTATVGGHYARPRSAADSIDRDVLQVLIHGGTYDHRYWNAPDVNGRSYSYAAYALDRGYSVLALDQLGVGSSSRPPGDEVNLAV